MLLFSINVEASKLQIVGMNDRINILVENQFKQLYQDFSPV